MNSNFLRKRILPFWLTIFLLVSLFFPQPAQAQLITHDIPQAIFQAAKWIGEKSWNLLEKAWEQGGAIAYRNTINFYLGEMAKQSAEYIASGGKGQKPMFLADPNYFSKMKDQALGEWINQTAQSFTGFTGKSLCDPMDPTLKFKMLVGLDPKYKEMMFDPEMRCSWSQLKERGEALAKAKIFDFDVELKQGRAGHYRAELASQIETDSGLYNEIKETLLVFIEKELAPVHDNLERLMEKTKAGIEEIKEADKQHLADEFEQSEEDWKKVKQSFQSMDIFQVNECFKKNKNDFCKKSLCRSLCFSGMNESECLFGDTYQICLDSPSLNATQKKVKAITDWIDEGIEGVKGVSKEYASFLAPAPVDYLADLNRSYNPEASDVAVLFKAESDLFARQADMIEKSKFMQSLSGDINRLTSKISDITLTPGSSIRAEWEGAIQDGSAGPKEYTGVAVADALGVFTNTLVSKLIENLFDKGLNPEVSPDVARSQPYLGADSLTNPDAGVVRPDREQSSILYADLATAQIKKGGEITIYDEFLVCPPNKKYAVPNNCLISYQTAKAMEQGLTIWEAMDQNLLNPDVFVGRKGDTDGFFSYNNIKKLRRYRIFPLGLEIAAKFNKENDREASLKVIVDNFYNQESPYYHLVDPNWVLKTFTYQCDLMGYSAIPVANSSNRQETCLDLKDCIHENEKGECDTWAYCTREKNIWRFDGEACASYYNTCQTYTSVKGNQSTAYLTNTLDFADCDPNNAGCQWYCGNWDNNLSSLGGWACVEPGLSQRKSRTKECSQGEICDQENGCFCEGTNGGCLVSLGEQSCSFSVYEEYEDNENVMFFNNQVATCSEKDLGCHEYVRIPLDLDPLDINPSEFKEENPELWENNKIYFQNPDSCSAKEVGCELYTPVSSALTVPGIVQEEDKCSVMCLGYETFQEMPSNFENSSRWVNLIPSLANTCQNPGCESFTNLETERTEYYSYLRSCVKTNASDEAIIDQDGTVLGSPQTEMCEHYFTWISSEETGYQLKEYFLKKGDDGGPARVSVNPNLEWGDCENKDDALENPHCRQFYDSEGKIYYRLYKNTVSCAPSCALYRRDLDKIEQMAISSQGEVCGQREKGCREYKGLAGDNFTYVFTDDFESGIDSRWKGGSISDEALTYPGQSLESDLGRIKLNVKDFVEKDHTYFISFWAKTRAGENIEVNFSSLSEQDQIKISSDSEWHEFKFGPFNFKNGPSNDEKLDIKSGDRLFIDNFILKQIQDNLYLIKDSWQTPCECDTLINHQNFATGARGCQADNTSKQTMVGCQTYQNRAGQSYYLKSFSRLCSSQTVGCEAMIDTQNSSEPGAQTYLGEIEVPADELVYLVNDSGKQCSSKYKGCQKFGQPELDINGEVVSYHNVYLINDPDLYDQAPILCLEEDLGCEGYKEGFYFKNPGDKVCEYRESVLIGGELKTGWFKKDTQQPCSTNGDGTPYMPDKITYGIRTSDDPDYEGWVGLCPKNQAGCTEFIDPVGINLISNPGFEEDGYKTGDKSFNAVDDLYKWHLFREKQKPVDNLISSSDISINQESAFTGKKGLEIYDKDGNEVVSATIIVPAKGNVEYSLSAEAKKILSTGHDQTLYLDFLDQNKKRIQEYIIAFSSQEWEKKTITEVSPLNTQYIRVILYSSNSGSKNSNFYWDNVRLINLDSSQGKYYYLNNSKINKSACLSQVGEKQGCILFNDTSQPTDSLIYDSAASYEASRENNDLLVNTINTDQKKGDANIAIKVRRDRVCGEWLGCISSRVLWDKSSGSYQEKCDFVARCDELIGTGESSQCGHFVYETDPKLLTKELYKERDVSWSGMDYAGHSLFNFYPIERLIAQEQKNGTYELTFIDKDSNEKGVNLDKDSLPKTCQLYPEADSPYAPAVKTFYSEVNLCSNEGGAGNYPNCQCSYQKATYTGLTKYYNDDSDIPNICLGGPEQGKRCSEPDKEVQSCGDGGQCVSPNKITTATGVQGWCLEKDGSKPEDINACLTWWPGPSLGEPDLEFWVKKAGVNLEDEDYYYCLHAEFQTTLEDRFYCVEGTGENGDCTVIMQVPAGSYIIREISDDYSWQEDLEPVTAVNGIELNPYYNLRNLGGVYQGAILNDGERFSVSDFNYSIMPEEKLLAAFQIPDGKKIYKYQWDAVTRTTKTKEKSWCGGDYSSCDQYCIEKSDSDCIEAIDWQEACNHEWDNYHLIDYACCSQKEPGPVFDGDASSSGDCKGDDAGTCGIWGYPFRNSRIWCNPGTDSYYVTAITGEERVHPSWLGYWYWFRAEDDVLGWYNGYEFDSTGNCNEDGCLQYCKTIAKIPSGLGIVLATDRYNSEDELTCYNSSGIPTKCSNETIQKPFGRINWKNNQTRVDIVPKEGLEEKVGASYFYSHQDEEAFLGATRLQEIFRKFKILYWQGEEYQEEVKEWDARNEATLGGPPKVASWEKMSSDEYEEKTAGKITIGNVDSGKIVRENGFYIASLKFFAWADKDRMPIREIVIDWGGWEDSNMVLGKDRRILAPNYRGTEKCSEEDDGFGGKEGVCEEKYHQYNYIYYCDGEGSPGWEKFECEGACCFKPRVFIKDNWGHCTNNVYAGDKSCANFPGAGISFGGTIIVHPQ